MRTLHATLNKVVVWGLETRLSLVCSLTWKRCFFRVLFLLMYKKIIAVVTFSLSYRLHTLRNSQLSGTVLTSSFSLRICKSLSLAFTLSFWDTHTHTHAQTYLSMHAYTHAHSRTHQRFFQLRTLKAKNKNKNFKNPEKTLQACEGFNLQLTQQWKRN